MRYQQAFGILALLVSFASLNCLRADDDLVVYDNDWNVPGSYIEQNALMPLLTAPHVQVLGLTSVTGDCWRDEGTANLLRYLEVIGRPDIPVYNGAVYPLVNTPARMKQWEQTYGFIYWKGAFNDGPKFPHAHPNDPYKIIPPRDRMPLIKPATERAADFLIDAVHQHPHQVTIMVGGPLTDIAQAISLDPEFSGLAKRLVFFGGTTGQVGDGDSRSFHSDFDVIFDPEAAHIAFSAKWAKIICVCDVANSFILTRDVLARIQSHRSPAGDYLAQNSAIGLPLWAEVMAEIVVDPTLVTKSTDVTIDVDTDHGMDYGRTVMGPLNVTPRLGPSVATIVLGIDGPRFMDQIVPAIQADVSKKGP